MLHWLVGSLIATFCNPSISGRTRLLEIFVAASPGLQQSPAWWLMNQYFALGTNLPFSHCKTDWLLSRLKTLETSLLPSIVSNSPLFSSYGGPPSAFLLKWQKILPVGKFSVTDGFYGRRRKRAPGSCFRECIRRSKAELFQEVPLLVAAAKGTAPSNSQTMNLCLFENNFKLAPLRGLWNCMHFKCNP